jgi:hypothetical protein
VGQNAFNQLLDRQLEPQLLELVSLNRRFGVRIAGFY